MHFKIISGLISILNSGFRSWVCGLGSSLFMSLSGFSWSLQCSGLRQDSHIEGAAEKDGMGSRNDGVLGS